jgi:hypothetical protein
MKEPHRMATIDVNQVEKEFSKLSKKTQTLDMAAEEARKAYEEANRNRLRIKHEEIALRAIKSMPTGSKEVLLSIAKQFAEVMKCEAEGLEITLGELLAKFKQQDKAKATGAVTELGDGVHAIDLTKLAEETVDVPVKKKRGRPKGWRKPVDNTATATAAVAAVAPVVEDEEEYDDGEED